ncbi:hypothetical protein Tco_0360567 [Tanacetum coccineum]
MDSLFGQDLETFTGIMFLNIDQLEKQLDKEEFQEIGSIAAFKVLETQFQMFIKSRIYMGDEYVVMTCNYFLQYTQLEIPEFCDTLIQHMESVKKSIDERAQHKREYDSWVNERQMQTIEEKVDTSKALDASLVDTESSVTESKEQDTSSRSENDAHADDADIRPIDDDEPMGNVQTTAKINVLATGQQHTEKPDFNNEGEVDQNAEQYHDTCPLPAKLTDNQITEHSYQSLESKNIWKLVLQPHRNQSVVRQPTAFKSERPRISKPRFASQVDVNNDLSKPVTTHYLPKEREFVVVKPHHVIASSKSRNSSKNMARFSSNDMVHNHYLEEAKKKTQESGRIQDLVPTGKIFTSSTTKVDSEPTNGSNEDITNQYECEQTLDVSAGTLNLSAAMTSDHNSLELEIHDHINEPSSSKLVPKVVPLADKTTTSQQELELLFSPMYEEYFNAGNQVYVSVMRTSKYGESNAFALEDLTLLRLENHVKVVFSKSELPDLSQTKLGAIIKSFQDDAKYEHVGQDKARNGGKDDQANKENI